MTEEFDDPSMRLHEFLGKQLASKAIAIALAEMVIRDFYGEDELNAQQPLFVSETPERWIIEGGREYDESAPRDHPQLLEGGNVMHIIKRNCRITKFSKVVAFASR